MIDFCKLISENQTHVNSLYEFSQMHFVPHRAQNNQYLSFGNGSNRFRLEFRKVLESGNLIGFRHVEICFSAHYYFNNDLHNGNDFAPVQCIKTLNKIIGFLQISKDKIQDFKVVNLEYGLNLKLIQNVPQLVNGLLYSKKTPFVINQYDTSKIAGLSKHKLIKAYDKGVQFKDFPHYQIDINTFRFEVKSKKSNFINKLGIYNLNDLLNLKKYDALFQSILVEWQNVLIINLELQNDANNSTYWSEILKAKDRNKFTISKQKYYQYLDTKDNLHHLIKCKLIDKITDLSKYAYFPQPTPINTQKGINENSTDILLKCKSAYLSNIKRYCLVTKLDISMQRKDAITLNKTGLKYYKETAPEIYKSLEKKYLKPTQKNKGLQEQLYFLAHNIRNEKYNPQNNRKRFEQRNYHKDQLQFNFK